MEKISENILNWYKLNYRLLPWRNTRNPYNIWLSETILQQTRVVQGLPYYQRFIEAYPTIKDLASANEQEVLRMWQGLGYYSRARNLLKCAQIVYSELGGEFPSTEKSLQKLPGIGPYTAAAIASISFNEPSPVLDGNVYRVLSRLFCIEEPINRSGSRQVFYAVAAQLIDGHPQPGNHNQAMMELGATICTPTRPNCQSCPANQYCCAFAQEKQQQLPVKLAKKKSRNRYFHYYLARNSKGIFLKKRSGNDIWKNLYELPLIETDSATPPKRDEAEKMFTKKTGTITKRGTVKHILTHQNIIATVYEVTLKRTPKLSNIIFVPFKELDKYPLPKLIENFLENYL